jgi:poly-gamma-glutamate synthesis protein (capsule biosynthesis protein)
VSARAATLLVLLLALVRPESGATSGPATSRTIRIVAGGDVAFGRETPRGVRAVGGAQGLDAVADRLAAADLTLVNLETPLCDVLPPLLPRSAAARPIRFRGTSDDAARLAAAGVDAVSLANNHTLDGGPDGLRATLAALEAAGVAAVGASFARDPWAPVLVTTPGGERVALLAGTDHLGPTTRRGAGRHPVALARGAALRERLVAQVGAARAAAPDAPVVVLLHWGVEGAPGPDRAQIALAHALLDAGATLVLGHGAHTLQPVEARGAGLVLYGLGDLLLDTGYPGAAALFEVTLARIGAGRAGGAGEWQAVRLEVHPLARATATRGPAPLGGAAGRSDATLGPLAAASARRFGTALRAEAGQLVWTR